MLLKPKLKIKDFRGDHNHGSISRMKVTGYTRAEIKRFQKILRDNEYSKMDDISCRCTKDYVCEICDLKRRRAEMDSLKIGPFPRNNRKLK